MTNTRDKKIIDYHTPEKSQYTLVSFEEHGKDSPCSSPDSPPSDHDHKLSTPESPINLHSSSIFLNSPSKNKMLDSYKPDEANSDSECPQSPMSPSFLNDSPNTPSSSSFSQYSSQNSPLFAGTPRSSKGNKTQSSFTSPLTQSMKKTPLSPDPFSPEKYATLSVVHRQTKFNFSRHQDTIQNLNEKYLQAKSHRQDKARQHYCTLARNILKHSRNTQDDAQRKQACRTTLEAYFIAYPNLSIFFNSHDQTILLDQQNIAECFQTLFFDSTVIPKKPKNIIKLLNCISSHTTIPIIDDSLMHHWAYVYIQLKYAQENDILNRFIWNIPAMMYSILRKDIELKVDPNHLPWRHLLLNALFEFHGHDTQIINACLTAVLNSGNKTYVADILSQGNQTEIAYLAHLIQTGQWESVILYLTFYLKEDAKGKAIIQSCLIDALTLHEQFSTQGLRTNMPISDFIVSLQKQTKKELWDFKRIADSLYESKKLNELKTFIAFHEFNELLSFDTAEQIQPYFAKLIAHNHAVIANQLQAIVYKRFQTHFLSLDSLRVMNNDDYSPEEWRELFLYAFHDEKKRLEPLKGTPRRMRNLFKANPEALQYALLSKLIGIIENTQKGITSISTNELFDKAERHELMDGSYAWLHEKLGKTSAIPQFQYIALVVNRTRGESKRNLFTNS